MSEYKPKAYFHRKLIKNNNSYKTKSLQKSNKASSDIRRGDKCLTNKEGEN